MNSLIGKTKDFRVPVPEGSMPTWVTPTCWAAISKGPYADPVDRGRAHLPGLDEPSGQVFVGEQREHPADAREVVPDHLPVRAEEDVHREVQAEEVRVVQFVRHGHARTRLARAWPWGACHAAAGAPTG
jgi:hypothetical protein